MLIQKSSLKPFTTELPAASHEIIRELRAETADPETFCHRLEQLTDLCGQTGKVEFSQYYEVLNLCDSILQHAVERIPEKGNLMNIDTCDHLDNVVIAILKFTSALFENTFFRSVYASFMELVKLLDTIKPKILIHTLRLLVSISKTSRYVAQHLDADNQKLLSAKLLAVYECWDKQRNAGTMTELIKSDALASRAKIPLKVEDEELKRRIEAASSLEEAVSILFSHPTSSAEATATKPDLERVVPLVQLRFNYFMDRTETRVESVIHCLMSMSVLFYSRCLLDEWRISNVVKDTMIEEICELVQLEPPMLDEKHAALVDNLRTEALKTLASIVFLEQTKKLQLIVDTLGLNTYLGYAANLMRSVVHRLKTGTTSHESTAFITSLFSLIYHIAGFENGGTSLINISTVLTLLDVVSLTTLPDSLISFATRSVRIIDILTTISFTEFNSSDGMQIIVKRLVFEIQKCKRFIDDNPQPTNRRFVCHHHRAALIKSLLNFLKRAVVDSSYFNHSRRIMEGDLPSALVHIFKHPLYYGASLVHCALELTTVFIYQEPAQLNALQDCGLSDAILELFFSDQFPINREIVLSLPNICSALCLNERGLGIFNKYKPLVRIFRIIFSSGFIQVLRKRKNELVGAGSQLGVAFDEFCRHQPTLRKELISAFATLVDEIIEKAKDESFNITSKPSPSSSASVQTVSVGTSTSEDQQKESSVGVEAEEKDDTAEASTTKEEPAEKETEMEVDQQPTPMETFVRTVNSWSGFSEERLQELKALADKRSRDHLVAEAVVRDRPTSFALVQEGKYLPLADYMILAIKIIEAILSNSTAAENSSAIIEYKLHEKLLVFFSTERIMPITCNPNYLHSIPNVFRLLLQQSRCIQTFATFAEIVKDQLTAFEIPSTSAELSEAKRFAELNRLTSLVPAFFNFLRMSLQNSPESRSHIFQYLSNDTNGATFIGATMRALQRFAAAVAHFAREYRESVARKSAAAGAAVAPQISVEISTETTAAPAANATSAARVAAAEISTETAAPPPPKEESAAVGSGTYSPSISAPYSMISGVYKNLVELVCQFGRSANSSRTRRIPEAVFQADTAKVVGELFTGLRRLFEEADYGEDNWPLYIQNALSMLRRLLTDENGNPWQLMLSHFNETGCHRVFFEIGEKLIKDKDLSATSTALFSWLTTVMNLLTVESVANTRTRSDRSGATRDTSSIDGYLATVQKDTTKTVGKIFDRVLDAHLQKSSAAEEKPSGVIDTSQLLDKVLEIFKELFHGIFYLHNKNKPAEPAQPPLHVLANEIDSDNVAILMDMGFSHESAVQALALYATVDEAAEHLLSRGEFPSAAAAPPSTLETIDEAPPTEGSTDPGRDGQSSSGQAAATKEKTVEEKSPAETFKDAVSYLCDQLVPKCLRLMEKEPAIVFSIADLLRVFINDPEVKEWTQQTLIRRIFVNDLNALLTNLESNFEAADELLVKRFAGVHTPGDTNNPVGSNVTALNVGNLPGLNTLGISMVRIDYGRYGINAPHTHPRATEILVVIEGTLLVGFVSSNQDGNRLFSKVLNKGDVFVFPEGLVHFQQNVGRHNAVAIAGLSSQNPGVVTIANTVFGSKPDIPTGIIAKAFKTEAAIIAAIQAKFP